MKNNSVFIIDDDLITVFGLKKILERISKEIKPTDFCNGSVALDAIKSRIKDGRALPSLIFLDINMPVMDGWTFLENFLELPITQKINIKIITSSIDIADRNKWQAYAKQSVHQIDYLTKPIHKLDINDLAVLEMAS